MRLQIKIIDFYLFRVYFRFRGFVMKKILIAFLTFTLGLFTFYFFYTEKIQNLPEVSPVLDISEAPEIEIEFEEDFAKPKAENLSPFFDSFKADVTDPYHGENEYQGYSGWFIADDFKGMKEIWTVLLSRDNENSKNKNFVWSVMILTSNTDGSPNDEDDFHSVWIKTESNHLSFKTNKIRGIEYKFDGDFFKKGKTFSDDEKVLKGTLQKIVKGKQVAKFTADFAYFEPRCFH